jgi:hypothetical protein
MNALLINIQQIYCKSALLNFELINDFTKACRLSILAIKSCSIIKCNKIGSIIGNILILSF